MAASTFPLITFCTPSRLLAASGSPSTVVSQTQKMEPRSVHPRFRCHQLMFMCLFPSLRNHELRKVFSSICDFGRCRAPAGWRVSHASSADGVGHPSAQGRALVREEHLFSVFFLLLFFFFRGAQMRTPPKKKLEGKKQKNFLKKEKTRKIKTTIN